MRKKISELLGRSSKIALENASCMYSGGLKVRNCAKIILMISIWDDSKLYLGG